MECPICKTLIYDTCKTQFCPTCHWELVVISADASQSLKAYFDRKLKAFQDSYSVITAIPSLESKIKRLEKENDDLERQIKDRKKDLKDSQIALSIEQKLHDVEIIIRETEQRISDAGTLAAQWDAYQEKLLELKDAYERAQRNGVQSRYLNEIRIFLTGYGLLP